MKKKIIVFFIMLFLLLLSYINKDITKEIIETKSENVETSNIEKEDNIKKVSINYNNKNETLELEEYVVGVLACEMPASFDIEALKALSVSARTYAVYKMYKNKDYVLKTTTKDQCYIDKETMKTKWKNNYEKYYNKILKATNETNNQILTYNDEPIIVFYFSISNGKTENVENVFSQKLDYLVSVDSSYDKKYNYKESTITIDLKDFYNKLNISKIENIDIEKTSSGRVNYIKINNTKYKGTTFRTMFNLKSTDFEIKINNDKVNIRTKGYGHGVGLSEYGANAMALEGFKYDEILSHYYKNTKLVNNY